MPTSQSKLVSSLESVLFAAGKPLSLKKLAELTSVTVKDVEQALSELQQTYVSGEHGLEVIVHQGEATLATHPSNGELVRQFLKKEEYGELTKPQLETLSVIAYRGPLTKFDLEQIRGVNCSLILRNLMIRGLVEEGKSSNPTTYQVTVDFLGHLGVTSLAELPNYSELSQHQNVTEVLTKAAD